MGVSHIGKSESDAIVCPKRLPSEASPPIRNLQGRGINPLIARPETRRQPTNEANMSKFSTVRHSRFNQYQPLPTPDAQLFTSLHTIP
jgi:hypothetical protein